MRQTHSHALTLCAGIILIATITAACADHDGESLSSDQRLLQACQIDAILALVNNPDSDIETLKALGVHSRAAREIIAARNGADAIAGTDDDLHFASIETLDAVPQVGPTALKQLASAGDGICAGDAPLGCQERAILDLLNNSDTSLETLKALGVHSRAAKNLIAARDGADAVPGTSDDRSFQSLDDVDAVSYVGPAAIDQLRGAVSDRCRYARAVEIIHSPAVADTHIERAVELIDAAKHNIDGAIYSFRDASIREAFARAIARGVTVRIISNNAADHRHDPAGTMSAKLEELGADVRYVNKIMHHKFMIVDGPHNPGDDPHAGIVHSGSANWTWSGVRFDENTAIVYHDAHLTLQFQREFNLLWEHSRDFVWGAPKAHLLTTPITDALLESHGANGAEAFFTSDNFRTWESSRYGATFSRVRGTRVAADAIVSIIQGAQREILIASGHMRSKPIVDALLAKKLQRPDIKIQVYLDGQEFVSRWGQRNQRLELETCLEQAGDSDAKREDCIHKGHLYALDLVDAGVDVRFKIGAYRWDYHYINQMHHKYIVVDGHTVISGSYNFSENAETNTMENIVVYRDARGHGDAVDSFEDNFTLIWDTGVTEGHFDALLNTINQATDTIPIVFDNPMSLSWAQVDYLKRQIRDRCPAVNSESYRQEPEKHHTCELP